MTDGDIVDVMARIALVLMLVLVLLLVVPAMSMVRDGNDIVGARGMIEIR